MEENELYDRIGETDLNPTYKDGQPYMHTDINQMLGILKTAINENYYDIQRLLNGVKTVGNAKKLDEATLSRYIDEELQSDDNKIPSSQQAKAYMDALFAGYSAPVRGVDYWTEADQQQIVSDTAINVLEEITPDLEEALNAKADINDIPTKVSDLTNDSEFITSLEMQESQSEQDIKINKKPYYFNSVADMKATNLEVGNCAITLGYYEPNDGGAGTYKIVDENLTDDGGSAHELNNDLFAKLLIENDAVNVKQFGAKGNGTTDDTQSIQNALNSIADRIYLAEGNYLITSTLVMPLNKTFYGSNANTCVLKGADFDNYILKYGESYHYGSKRGKLENIRIESNGNDNYTYGLYLNSGLEIRNVYFNRLKQAVSKVNNYIDNIVLYRCHIMYCGGKENSYIVDLPSNGDSILISQCQFGSAYTTENFSNYLGIRIQGSTGCLIENNVLNVPVLLHSCVATMLNNHMEGPSTNEHFNLSNINIINSNVLIDTLFIHKCIDKPEIAIQNEDYNETHNSEVTLKNVGIWLTSLMFKHYQNMENMYDLYIGQQCVVNIENVFNNLDYSAGWASVRPATGIKVKDHNGLLEDFNNISSFASIKSTISFGKVYINNLLPVNVNSTNNSLQYSNNNQYTPWFESGYNNNNIYYKRVSCYDFERKLCASISSEKEITGITSYVSDNNKGKGGAVNNIPSFMNQTVGRGLLDIIYRGDTTGNYNKITKIPVICARALYDFGTHICGYPTESRTSGDIDDFNIVSNFKRIGNNVEFTSSSIPSYGTFIKGDRCINSSIASGSIKSWIYDGTNWVSEGSY